jgi:hypothetical protein
MKLPKLPPNFASIALGIGAGLTLDNLNPLKALRTAYHTAKREMLIHPNKHSKIKVQGYSFSLNADLTLGTPSSFDETLQPNAMTRPKRMVTNIHVPAMVKLSSVQIANVNVLIGEYDDAFIYEPSSFGLETEFPTLDTSTRATMTGSYSGYIPKDYDKDFPFTFVLTFQGPSMLYGNG